MHELRQGEAPDAEELACLHVDVWRATYRDLATPEAYRILGADRRLPYWQETLTSTAPETGAIVGVLSGQISGVVSFGTAREGMPTDAIEIKHLYVSEATQGTGLGGMLLQAVFDHFRKIGRFDVALAVVEENAAARAFYRHLGGQETGRFVDPGPLWRSSNIVVRWALK